jgi:DNA-directed RNA polymerase subunit RPC12/RpoP
MTRPEIQRTQTHTHAGFGNPRQFKCPDCPGNILFKTRKVLQNHVEAVHEAERYCVTCGKTFSSKWAYKDHMTESRCQGPRQGLQRSNTSRNEEEKNERECHVCGREFTTKQVCQNHIQDVHLGRKPYKCKLCGKMFSQKKAVDGHFEARHVVEWLREIKAKSKVAV